MLGIGQFSTTSHLTIKKTSSSTYISTGSALQLGLAKVMARTMAMFLAWTVIRAVIRTWPIVEQ